MQLQDAGGCTTTAVLNSGYLHAQHAAAVPHAQVLPCTHRCSDPAWQCRPAAGCPGTAAPAPAAAPAAGRQGRGRESERRIWALSHHMGRSGHAFEKTSHSGAAACQHTTDEHPSCNTPRHGSKPHAPSKQAQHTAAALAPSQPPTSGAAPPWLATRPAINSARLVRPPAASAAAEKSNRSVRDRTMDLSCGRRWFGGRGPGRWVAAWLSTAQRDTARQGVRTPASWLRMTNRTGGARSGTQLQLTINQAVHCRRSIALHIAGSQLRLPA